MPTCIHYRIFRAHSHRIGDPISKRTVSVTKKGRARSLSDVTTTARVKGDARSAAVRRFGRLAKRSCAKHSVETTYSVLLSPSSISEISLLSPTFAAALNPQAFKAAARGLHGRLSVQFVGTFVKCPASRIGSSPAGEYRNLVRLGLGVVLWSVVNPSGVATREARAHERERESGLRVGGLCVQFFITVHR